MLTHLQIRDFAIVEAVELEFGRGFTALTGETGAGKSILIDALMLAVGGRATAARYGTAHSEPRSVRRSRWPATQRRWPGSMSNRSNTKANASCDGSSAPTAAAART